MQKCKSYCKRLNRLSWKNGNVTNVPKIANSVTIDVQTIYTNIYPEEGAPRYYNKLEERKNKTIPSNL